MNHSLRLAFATAWVLWGCMYCESVDAHPFHISLAEMQFNPESEKFEVSLKVHAVDLENALSRMSGGEKVDVESKGLDKLVSQFLERYFYLMPLVDADRIARDSAAGSAQADSSQVSRSKVTYVGKEMETSWIWLYFELEPPQVDGDLALVNAVFLDTIEMQINTVSVRVDKRRHALKLTRKEPWSMFPRAWMAKQTGP